MLPKEVKNILEGIHYFLLEDLKNESLSGKVECMRRGLLLQLEELKAVVPLQFTTKFDPNANIQNCSSVSLPYLNTDQIIANGSSRMSTSSSGSANYSTGYSNESSTGYSGDGVVSSHSQNGGGSDNAHSDFSSENYEEFDDVKEPDTPTTVVCPIRKLSSELQRQDSRASSGYDDKEDQDDDCIVDADPIPFRFLIAKCDYHCGLLKRSKGLLKSYKSFLGVLTGPHLYLYQKDTDDQQRKVIDLTGYEVRDVRKELKSRSKNKDFSFELIRPGRKTHTFYSAKRKDREMWIEHLQRATTASKSTYQNMAPHSQRFPLAKVEETTQQINMDEEESSKDEDEGEEADVADDDENIYDDFYEELYIDVEPGGNFPPASVPFPPSISASEGVQNDLSYYYTVPEDNATIEVLTPQGRSKRLPPARPPLPRLPIGKRPPAVRPLPEAPEEASYPEEDSTDDIYCEIEGEDCVESLSHLAVSSRSLSQEIFDTINQRGTPLPELFPQKLNFERDEARDFESYDVPSDVSIFSTSSPCKQNCKVPFLPPKGVPAITSDDENESEYKVPAFSKFPENIYNVPPANPILVCQTPEEVNPQSAENLKNQNKSEQIPDSADNLPSEKLLNKKVFKLSSNPLVSSSPLVQSSPINSEFDSKKQSKAELETNGELSPEINAQSEPKKVDKSIEISTSNSVKDLIAKLNQNDPQKDGSPVVSYGSFKLKNGESKQQRNSIAVISVSEPETKIPMNENKNELDLQNEDKVFSVSKLKTFIEKKSVVSENLKNKVHSSVLPDSTNILKIENCENNTLDNNPQTDKQNIYVAKFAFVSIDPEALSFSRGDEILVTIPEEDTRWWKGICKGRQGLVPKEYLRRKEELLSAIPHDSRA